MDARKKIEEIDDCLKTLRESKSIVEIKFAFNELINLFRELQNSYISSKNAIPWNQMESLLLRYKSFSETTVNRNTDKSQIIQDTDQFVMELKQRILPISQRYLHFFGALSFVILIPIMKFWLATSHKLGANSWTDLKFSNFDVALPIVIYSWIVCFIIDSSLRKTWVITFSLFITSFLGRCDEYLAYFNIILILAMLIFLIHIYDSWYKHVRCYSSYSYFK